MFKRAPILRVQSTKQPIPWPTFPALWSRWKDHRTIRQTVLESLLQWEENTTAQQPGSHWKHITQWKHAHAHALAQTRPRFLTLSSLATQRDSPNVTSNVWLMHRGPVGLFRSQLISFPLTVGASHTHRATPAENVSFMFKRKTWGQVKLKVSVCVLSCRLLGRVCPPPPVFTHKQSNLQPD